MRRSVAVLFLLVFAAAPVFAADALVVKGDVARELHLTLAMLRELPHVEATVTDAHHGETIAFRGVSLSVLLERAGVALGEHLRGKELATCIVAEASDGYRVVLSIGEADPKLSGSDVFIADTANGKPIDDKSGPLRLVVPRDLRPARWVRSLTALRVVKVR